MMEQPLELGMTGSLDLMTQTFTHTGAHESENLQNLVVLQNISLIL